VNAQPLQTLPPRRAGRFWFFTAVALLSFAAMVSLGRWQLSRAAQKEALQAEIEAQQNLPPVDAQAFLALADATSAMHRPVRLRGLWLTPHTVYLDNRPMHGLPGFYVLTPFALEGTEQTVLIQRGWIQRNFTDRAKLEPIETPSGLVEVTARIAPPPAHLLELGKDEGAAAPAPAASAAAAPTTAATPESVGSSRIRLNLALEAFRAETGLPLRTDVSLQQTGPASEGLQRDWPAPALGVEKHYGYAFQWFGLAALVVLLYVWFQLIAPFRRARLARRG
jgi:cytochrome oxidase assembly protein ShyY1